MSILRNSVLCYVVISALLTLPVLSQQSSKGAQGQTVVATIGDHQITLDEFRRRLNELRQQATNPPTPEQFLEELIRYEIGVQEARKQNLENDPIVQERFRQELYKALIERALGEQVEKIQVTEAEMRRFYQRNPEIQLSHILIEFRVDATPEQKAEARSRAEMVLGLVRKGDRPFEEIARNYSDDSASKVNGGDIGYHNRVSIMPQVYEAAVRLRVNQTSGILETPYGFHIIRVTGRRSFQQANRRAIRAAVFDEKRKQLFDQYFDRLKRGYKIQSNVNAVRNL